MSRQRNSGAAAEALVLGQLLRRKVEAYQAQPFTAHHDIVLVIDKTAVRLQVKSKAWITPGVWVPIKAATLDGADFIVIVDLREGGEEPERYYIVPVADARPVHYEPPVGNPLGEIAGFKMSALGADYEAKYRDAWSKMLR